MTDERGSSRAHKGLVGAVAVLAVTSLSASPAGAVSLRTGARPDHLDIMFTRAETQSIARGFTGGAKACAAVVGAATAAGVKAGPKGAVLAAFVSGGVCMMAVTTCAARANRYGQRAGITISPARWTGVRYWCWRY